jgi:hypothetical protein
MSRTFGKLGLVVVVGVLVVALALSLSCGLFLYLSFVSYPSPKVIGQRYVAAVVNEDLSAAPDLARSKEECRAALREDALEDIDEFGGAEVRNVSIGLEYNDGSDDGIQFAVVEFEYLEPGNEAWQSSSMRLVTDHDVPGLRYLCGRSR